MSDEALKLSTMMVSTVETFLDYFTRFTRCKDMALFVYSLTNFSFKNDLRLEAFVSSNDCAHRHSRSF